MRRILFLAILLAWAPLLPADDVLRLSDHHGKVVMIDFWASWCVPCRRSFPWMNEMHNKYSDDGLVIIAVNVDRDTKNAAAFLDKYPANFDIVYDQKAELAKEYEIEVMPSSFLIGRNGEHVDRHSGFKVKRQDEYEDIIRATLERESEE